MKTYFCQKRIFKLNFIAVFHTIAIYVCTLRHNLPNKNYCIWSPLVYNNTNKNTKRLFTNFMQNLKLKIRGDELSRHIFIYARTQAYIHK